MKIIKEQKAITLIALIVSIVVMLILSSVSVTLLIGDSGIITKAQEAKFRQEMNYVEEQVKMEEISCMIDNTPITDIFTKQVKISDLDNWKSELRVEIVMWGKYEIGISQITRDYAKKHWKEIIEEKNGDTGLIEGLYYIDKSIAGDENKYLYDIKTKMIYKIPRTKIGVHKIHSIKELDYQFGKKVNDRIVGNVISDSSNIMKVGTISHYEPNLSGFVEENTKIIYYSQDNKSSIEVPAIEYIQGGKQRTIQQSGSTYIFYDYENKKWANIVIENEGIKSYWVWIPRYAYKIEEGTTQTQIQFLSKEDKVKDGYILHSDFEDGKKGIWVSKYEPIQEANSVKNDFPYYIPDMTGFNKDNTYIEVFDENTKQFKETKLSEVQQIDNFAKQNKWFDYKNSIWANIKTVNPTTNVEAWWVWIPRYAYNITGSETSILFVDLNNNPLTGENLPSNYVVHSAFESGKKGIWVSKYEPVQKIVDGEKTNNVNPPNLVGFNVENTYIECYNENGKLVKEKKLREILNNNSIIENNIVKKAEIDFSKISGIWYAYDKKMWANIKTVNPTTNAEAWWVWIPRYAYNITGLDTKIIFLDENGNPRDGTALPSNYVPHSAFNENKEGIWASKFEPLEKK